ncbi:MAG: PilZ domain-containing protein, partial [Planctomycetaceae bacterium]|nr:PilZ domain-containing protein [Planctomycetaceae bacterium]
TEDMHTGMRMHAKGWNSLFVNERLIAAQAAPDITSFNTQRLRWGEGNLGIIAFDNPLTIKGLTLAQRLCYLGSMLSWTTGVQKLTIYLAPILMLLTGVPPVINLSWTLGIMTLVYMICVWTGVKVSSNGYGKLLAIELTQMACFWTQVKGTWRAIFNRKKANFVVTSKRGRQSNSILKHIAPQITYILTSVVAITWATMRFVLHLSNDLVGLSLGAALLLFHSWLAWVVIRRALKPGDQRYSWRHPASFHVGYKMKDGLGEPFSGFGITRDLNERGLGLIAFEELPENKEIEVTISAGDRTVTCQAEIRWRKTLVQFKSRRDGFTQAYRYGLQFGKLDTQQLDNLWWLGAQYAVARQYERFEGGQFGIDPDEIEHLPERKDEHELQLPVIVDLWDDATVATVTETVGSESFTVLLPTSTPNEQATEWEMITPFGLVRGWATVAEVQPREIAGAKLYETRFQFCRFLEESRGKLTSALGHSNARELAPVMRLKPEIQPLPMRRPAAMLGGVSTTVAALVIGCAVFIQRDEAAIASVIHDGTANPQQVARLENMVNQVREAKSVDEAQVLRLRAAMRKLDREDEVRTLDAVLAKLTTTSLDGQLLKAVSLQNLGQHQEAETFFEALIKRRDELYSNKTRAEL